MSTRSGPVFSYAGLEATEEALRESRPFFRAAAEMLREMRRATGCLWTKAVHNGRLENAILSWWFDREAIETWHNHPAHRTVVAYGFAQRTLLQSGMVKTWIEFYEPALVPEIAGEQALLIVGAARRSLAHRSLRDGRNQYELSWVDPHDLDYRTALVLRQQAWGVRSCDDAGAPFSKTRVLDWCAPAATLGASHR